MLDRTSLKDSVASGQTKAAELTANSRHITGLHLASGDGSSNFGAGSWAELVARIQRDQRNPMPQGAHRTHLVEAGRGVTFAGQHRDIDVLVHRARLVGLHTPAWSAI